MKYCKLKSIISDIKFVFIYLIFQFLKINAIITIDTSKCELANNSIICSIDICKINTYIYYNNQGYFCSNPKLLTLITEDGYYINNELIKGKNQYLIKRTTEIDGEIIFKSVLGKDGYYINAGSDKNTYGLIFCQSDKGCITGYVSRYGYYIPGDQIGIINCSENFQCKLEKEVSNFYINAGYQRKAYSLIQCKKGKCVGTADKNGYYLMHEHSTLIKCHNHQCEIVPASIGYYLNAENPKYNIMCIKFNANISCGRRIANVGIYISAATNILLNCMREYCQEDELYDGIYRASTTYNLVPNGSQRDKVDTKTMYNLISCEGGICKELSIVELHNIPICSYSNGVCYITPSSNPDENTKNYLIPGDYCTNENHSTLYLATGIISTKQKQYSKLFPSDINCLSATGRYINKYYFFASKLFKVEDGKISEINKIGYYFINIIDHTLIESDNIRDYDNEDVEILYCNGNYCKIWERPDVVTYIVNTSHRILKYNPRHNTISFAYDYDLKCTHKMNSCIIEEPDEEFYKLKFKKEKKENEFCVTNDGELALLLLPKDESIIQFLDSMHSLQQNKNPFSMKNANFTLNCNKARHEDESIYGFTKHLYHLNLKSAKVIDNTGHYIINSITNKAINKKDFRNINKFIKIYNCIYGHCEPLFNPSSDYYYYDNISQLMLKYHNNNNTWEILNDSGYIYASINPKYVSIFEYTTLLDQHINLNTIQEEGDYYTLDNQLYTCVKLDRNIFNCEHITKPNYYFTVNGFILHCDNVKIEEDEDDNHEHDYEHDRELIYHKNKTKKKNKNKSKINEEHKSESIHSNTNSTLEQELKYKEINGTIEEKELVKDDPSKYEFKCMKMKCNPDEFYSIYDSYYQCASDNYLLLKISNKQCSFDEKVVINYPTMFSNSMDEDVYRQVLHADILQEKYDNKTIISKNSNSNVIHSIHGVFTNCTYDNEVKVFNYDLICAEDQIVVNITTKTIEICSKMDFGFIQCVAEDNNPDKCNPNSSIKIHIPILELLAYIILHLIFFFH